MQELKDVGGSAVPGAAQENTVSCYSVGSHFTEGLWEHNSCNLFSSAPRAITQAMLKQPHEGPSSAAKSQGPLSNSPHWRELLFQARELAVMVDPHERRYLSSASPHSPLHGKAR